MHKKQDYYATGKERESGEMRWGGGGGGGVKKKREGGGRGGGGV